MGSEENKWVRLQDLQHFLAEGSLDDCLQHQAALAAQLLGAGSCSIMLLNSGAPGQLRMTVLARAGNLPDAALTGSVGQGEGIAGQVLAARDRLGDWPGGTRPTDGVIPSGERCVTNIVMMGMGEPLYNFEAVRDAILIMSDGEGIGISKRRITLSTSGVVPNIERAGAEIGCMLAISLHAVRDELRNELVPLNRKYPIAQLMEACRNYPGASNAKRITFEYVMLKDVNDSIADAKALVQLLKGIPAKINLIPFNPWPGTRYECSDWDQIEKFSQVVFDAGYASPVRTPRGRDIFAACGQLKSATEKMSARERMALRAMAMTDE